MVEFAERAGLAAGEAAHRRGGLLLQSLFDGLASELQRTDQTAVGPTDRGWSPALDVDESAFLAWLGRTLGTPIPVGLAPSEQRDYIRSRIHERRGSILSVEEGPASLLTGTQRVDIYERIGSPWAFLVRVYQAEAVGVTVEELEAAIAPVKPIGLVASFEVAVGASYGHMASEHGTYAEFVADFATYEDARTHVPEEGSAP